MTDDPYVVALIQAQRIYSLTGIPTKPWEVGQWPDEWLDAMRAYMVDVDKKKNKIRAANAPPKRKGR